MASIVQKASTWFKHVVSAVICIRFKECVDFFFKLLSTLRIFFYQNLFFKGQNDHWIVLNVYQNFQMFYATVVHVRSIPIEESCCVYWLNSLLECGLQFIKCERRLCVMFDVIWIDDVVVIGIFIRLNSIRLISQKQLKTYCNEGSWQCTIFTLNCDTWRVCVYFAVIREK